MTDSFLLSFFFVYRQWVGFLSQKMTSFCEAVDDFFFFFSTENGDFYMDMMHLHDSKSKTFSTPLFPLTQLIQKLKLIKVVTIHS